MTNGQDIVGALLHKLEDRSLHVGVVGLGYVGLPLALTFVERGGLRVTGFDVDAEKIASLNRGESYIMYVGPDRIAKARADHRFEATADLGRLGEPDALLIAVPTPLTAQRTPDMRYVVDTTRAIRDTLRAGQLVVLESTTYPGTTDELVRGILEETGLVCGQQFLLAFSPEREDPGNRRFSTATIPKVVGGVDPAAAEVASALYGCAVEKVVRVESARAAEAVKLTENVFRAVNIALVNELKVIYDRMGIDIWDVLDAAATKPFGFMKFTPGPGLGGHCIPLDPFYLTWKAREYGLTTRFIELSGEINVAMPGYVIDKLQQALNRQRKALSGSRILLLGIAYKRDIDDPRESPSFELLDRLRKGGAQACYHDPHIPQSPRMRSWPDLPPMQSQELSVELLQSMDAVVIATDHSQVDYALVLEHAPLVVDTRGVYRGAHSKVIKA